MSETPEDIAKDVSQWDLKLWSLVEPQFLCLYYKKFEKDRNDIGVLYVCDQFESMAYIRLSRSIPFVRTFALNVP